MTLSGGISEFKTEGLILESERFAVNDGAMLWVLFLLDEIDVKKSECFHCGPILESIKSQQTKVWILPFDLERR